MLGSIPDPGDIGQEMATTATIPEVRALKRRRVIERPRLLALLDESKARVRTLVAPAGYGKSTLAEQWVARAGRNGAWYTARSSSTDVAALSLGLARACTGLVEGCDIRLREHLRALPAPAENVENLAEILGEGLETWPAESWLVIDDYHEIAMEPNAERFVSSLVAASTVHLLIASRQRPAWVSAKKILYGDVLELNQTALAMDSHEAADVLVGRSAPSASGLVSIANGWPAVIGLASVSFAEIESDADQVPESLYRFFAEEVFSALGSEVQQGLTTLSVAPVLDRALANGLLGLESAESVCAAALDVGILVERGAQLELHPLARAFLAERSEQLGLVPADGTVAACLEIYRARREWDAAFDVIVRSGPAHELEPLMLAALDELLTTGRLPTLQRWCESASHAGLEAPVVSVARAEVALRSGRHVEAMAHAEAAASKDSELAFRALSVAGRAAHLASREEEALELYRRAEAAASTDSERRDAMWGQLRCFIDLELPDAEPTLARLSKGVTLADTREVVRTAAHGLYLQLRLGSLDLEEADRANQLLSAVNDPIVESSFESGYAIALALAARYKDARSASAGLLETARRVRLEFAVPYALCGDAMAHSGLREWQRAERSVSEALSIAERNSDVHAELLGRSILLRVLAQQARCEAALELETTEPRTALRASVAEFRCSRGLVLACMGRTVEALALVDQCREASQAVEPVVLIPAIEAICALKTRANDAIDRVIFLDAMAFAIGAVDLLVVAYRACPELLAVLLRVGERDRLRDLLRRVGDADLADAMGLSVAEDDPRARLSPREREVFELLRERLTNRQIAKLLFIEESTVKAHAHRIYDKLGTRSRTTLAVQAVLERANQATSATEPTDSVRDSS
ncbi:MAG: LuxR C-terminal-related transcriptional regulator [Thermoleophilia bacterium]|nr:LuxR C-terminal-related transcriptional regulator [Thermoleophilia bacterium]